MTHKIKKFFFINFKFGIARCSLLRAEDFSLDVLYGGLGISKLQWLTKKKYQIIFSAVNFCQCLVIKRLIRMGSGSGSVFTLKCRIRNQ